MYRPILIALFFVFCVLSVGLFGDVYGFGPETKIFIAEHLRSEALNTENPGIIQIDDYEYGIPKIIEKVLVDYPDYYRAGVVGLDVFPDLLETNMIIHDGPAKNDVLIHLIEQRIQNQCNYDGPFENIWSLDYDSIDSDCRKLIAYDIGFNFNVISDVWSNSLTNQLIHERFGDVTEDENIKNHLIIERYIDKKISSDLVDKDFKIPHEIFKELFIYDVENFGRAEIFDYLFSLGAYQNTLLDKMEDDLDSLKDDRPGLIAKEAAACLPIPTPACALATKALVKNERDIDLREEQIDDLKKWIQRLNSGISSWSQFSEQLAIRMVNPSAINEANTLSNDFAIGTSNSGISFSTSIEELIEPPNSFYDSENLNAAEKLLLTETDYIDMINTNVLRPNTFLNYQTQFLENLIQQSTGLDITTYSNIINDPESQIDTSIEVRLLEVMPPSFSESNLETFSTLKNTILHSKLIFLNNTELNDLLCKYGVGSMYYPFDKVDCSVLAGSPIPDFTYQYPCDVIENFKQLVENRELGIKFDFPSDCESIPDDFSEGSLTVSDENDLSVGFYCFDDEDGKRNCLMPDVRLRPDKTRYDNGELATIEFLAYPPSLYPLNFQVIDPSGTVTTPSVFETTQGSEVTQPSQYDRKGHVTFTLDKVGDWKVIARYMATETELVIPSEANSIKPTSEFPSYVENLESSQQWRKESSIPIQNNVGDGMPLWNDCVTRERVFRGLFDDWQGEQFPNDGESSSLGISNTPAPTSRIIFSGPFVAEAPAVNDGAIKYRVGHSTTFKLTTDYQYTLDAPGYWLPHEMVTYQTFAKGSSNPPEPIKVQGDQEFGPLTGSVGEYVIKYRTGGICDSPDGEVQEGWHTMHVILDLGLTPESLFVATNGDPFNEKIKRYKASNGDFLHDLVSNDGELVDPSSLALNYRADPGLEELYVLSPIRNVIKTYDAYSFVDEVPDDQVLINTDIIASDFEFYKDNTIYVSNEVNPSVKIYDASGRFIKELLVADDVNNLEGISTIAFGPGGSSDHGLGFTMITGKKNYGHYDMIAIKIREPSANDPFVIDTIDASVFSNENNNSVDIPLIETGRDTGVFERGFVYSEVFSPPSYDTNTNDIPQVESSLVFFPDDTITINYKEGNVQVGITSSKIAEDTYEYLYVADHVTNSVKRFKADNGMFIDEFIESNNGGLSLPRDLLLLPDGDWLVSNFLTDEIKRYNHFGAFVADFVTEDRNGNGHVDGCEEQNNPHFPSIGIPGGNVPDEFEFYDDEIPCSHAGLDGPWGMKIRNGVLYVSSRNTDEVLMFDGNTGLPLFSGTDNDRGKFIPVQYGGLSKPTDLIFWSPEPIPEDNWITNINNSERDIFLEKHRIDQVFEELKKTLSAEKFEKIFGLGVGGLPLPDPLPPLEPDIDLSSSIDVLLDKSRILILDKKFDYAKIVFDNILLRSPDNIHAQIGKADVLINQGHFIESEQILDKVITLEPQNSLALIGKGKVLQLQGNLDAAELQFDKVLTIDPDNIHAQIGKADVLINQGHFIESEQILDKVITLEPQNSLALIGKGKVLQLQGNLDAAELQFDKVLTIDPDNIHAQIGKADVLINQGHFIESEQILDKVITLEPQNPLALVGRGSSSLSMGNIEDAQISLGQAIQINPNVLKHQIFTNPDISINPSVRQQSLENIDSPSNKIILGITSLLSDVSLLDLFDSEIVTISSTEKSVSKENQFFALIGLVGALGFAIPMGIIAALYHTKIGNK